MFKKDSSGEYLEQLTSNGVQRYRRRRVLGKGGFAKCYEVSEQKTDRRFACKAIDKQSISHCKLKEKLQSEIEIHRRLLHKNIVRFESVFEDEKFIYILLELCANNTLNELLKRRKVLSELQTRYYLQQLLGALKYLHKLKIIHRDLKLDNFFLGDNLEIKIGDFGLAAMGSQPRKTICGTPSYIAPEILDSRNGYSYEVDVWSIGIATYLMLYGRYPFDASDPKNVATRINSKTYLINPSVSEYAKSFISKMLKLQPCDRATVKQLLQHQFLTHFEIPLTLPRSSLACPLNSNFLQQYKPNKTVKLQLPKEDQEFNFMLESKESPSSPRFKPSNISISMSASKILQLSKIQNLPYVFSQKKVRSFHYQQNQGENDLCMEPWISRWWQFPKYGLFYQTTDNSLGARFNDGSSIKSHTFPQQFTVIPSNKTEKKIVVTGYKIKSLSKQLLSKMKAFQQMKQKSGANFDQNQYQGVYVKMYVRSVELFILWLSNGNIQCRFQDKSELIVSPKQTIYISADKIRIVFQSKLLLNQNMDIIKRQRQLATAIKRIAAIKSQINVQRDQDKLLGKVS